MEYHSATMREKLLILAVTEINLESILSYPKGYIIHTFL